MAHELGHYVLGHPNYDDAHQRERDANAKGVEIMVRLGTGGDEALRRMHAVLVGTYRFQARTGKWPSLGHNPCAEIRRRIRAAASAAHRAASEGAWFILGVSGRLARRPRKEPPILRSECESF